MIFYYHCLLLQSFVEKYPDYMPISFFYTKEIMLYMKSMKKIDKI